MLQRIIGILKLDVPTYEEVEHDPGAYREAAIIVAVVAIATAVSAAIAAGPDGNPIFGALGSLLAAFIGWYISAWVTYKVGVGLFKGEADLQEMLRVLGYAQAPMLLTALKPIPAVGPLIAFVGSIWTLIAYFIAVRQGLDISNGKTFATIAIVTVVYLAVIFTLVVGLPLMIAMMLGSALTT